MKTLFRSAFLLCAFVSNAYAGRQGAIQTPPINVTAVNIQTEGSIIHLKGSVVLRTNEFTLKADEMDFHSDTKEVSARGNVEIQQHNDRASQFNGTIDFLEVEIARLQQQLADLLITRAPNDPRVMSTQLSISTMELKKIEAVRHNAASSGWIVKAAAITLQLPQSTN
jgi:hypothetical protein